MTQVVSLEAQFKATGVQDVKNGFAEIGKAAKAAQQQEKALAKERQANTKVLLDYNRRMAAEEAKMAAQAKQQASQRITDWKNQALAIGAVAVGVGVAAKKVYEFGKQGAQLEFTKIKFDRLAASIGTTGDAMLGELKFATKGTLSDFQAMATATDLLALGLVKTKEDTIRLAKVQAGLGMDTGELTLALANQTTRRFDQLGVSLEGFAERLAALKATGMDANSAFTEAFLQQSEAQLIKVGNAADTSAGQFMVLEASMNNVKDSMKIAVAQAIVPAITAQNKFREEAQLGNELMLQYGGNIALTRAEWNMYGDRIQAAANEYKRAEQYGMAWKVALDKQNLALAGQNGELENVVEVTEESFKAALQMTDINEQYSNQTRELTELLAEQTAEQEKLHDQGFITKALEMNDAINKTKDSLRQLGAAQQDTSEQMMLSILASKDATVETQLSYALASGQITQDAYNQQAAFMAIADALSAGQMNAQQAQAAVIGVTKGLMGLNGKEFTTYLNLIITGGNIPSFQNQTIVNKTGMGGINNEDRFDQEAAGGPLGSGWNLVGEQGQELIDPTGFVYTAQQTKNILQSGLTGFSAHRIGGDLAGTGVFGTEGAGGFASNVNGKKRPKGGSGGSGSGSGGGSSNINAVIPTMLQITDTIISASGTVRERTARATMMQNSKVISLLESLLAKTASEDGISRAVIGQGSKWNG